MQHRLAGGISAANHKDILIAAKRGFARARTVVNSSAQELLLFGKIQPAIFDAGGTDDAAGHDFGSIGQITDAFAGNKLAANPLAPKKKLGAKTQGLLARSLRQFRAANSPGKAEVIFDF